VTVSFRDQLAQIEEIEREVRRIQEGERSEGLKAAKSEYRRAIHAAGLAQAVAGCYTRIEHVLDFVARAVDGEPVRGENWHRTLLDRMARPRDDVPRPAVISGRTHGRLDELRQFRHVVKSIYPSLIRSPDVARNLALLISATPRFAAEFRAFVKRMTRPRRN
jgi:hypothetical protein